MSSPTKPLPSAHIPRSHLSPTSQDSSHYINRVSASGILPFFVFTLTSFPSPLVREMLILFMFMSLIHVQIFSALPYIPLHEGERSFVFGFLVLFPSSPFRLSCFLFLFLFLSPSSSFFFSLLCLFPIGLLTWRLSFFLGAVMVYRLVLFESVLTRILAQDQGVLGILVMEWEDGLHVRQI